MILFKSENDIKGIEKAGKVVAEVLDEVASIIRHGLPVEDIEKLVRTIISDWNARAAFLNYQPPGMRLKFPYATCVSVNEEVVHGFPRGKVLKKGDLVKVDVGVELGGYYADAARTYVVEEFLSKEDEELFRAGLGALQKAVELCKPGNTTGTIGEMIWNYAHSKGFGVVTSYTGHGVGFEIHEDPEVPNFGKDGEGELLVEGMVIAIEPMLTHGSGDVRVKRDGWTVVTVEGKRAVHFEYTVAVTRGGGKVLTPWKCEMLQDARGEAM